MKETFAGILVTLTLLRHRTQHPQVKERELTVCKDLSPQLVGGKAESTAEGHAEVKQFMAGQSAASGVKGGGRILT